MARKKVQLRYIENPTARKASLKKRRQGLLKKVDELSILCDVKACVIVYSEDRDELPLHWPADRGEVEVVLGRFEACPEEERRKRMMTIESYMKERIEKCKMQMKRLGCSIRELEMFHMLQLMCVDGRSHGEFSTSQLKGLREFADEKIEDLERKANFLSKNAAKASPRPPPPAPSFRFPAGNFEVGGGSGTANDPDGNCEAAYQHKTVVPMGAPTVFPYGADNVGNAGSYSVNQYQWSSIVGVGDISDIVRGYTNVGYSMGQPQGNVGAIPGLQGPMIGGNIRGHGYNVEAPAENVPGAVTGNIVPASMTTSNENDPIQGGGNTIPDPRGGGSSRI